jgi:hypothetical protein
MKTPIGIRVMSDVIPLQASATKSETSPGRVRDVALAKDRDAEELQAPHGRGAHDQLQLDDQRRHPRRRQRDHEDEVEERESQAGDPARPAQREHQRHDRRDEDDAEQTRLAHDERRQIGERTDRERDPAGQRGSDGKRGQGLAMGRRRPQRDERHEESVGRELRGLPGLRQHREPRQPCDQDEPHHRLLEAKHRNLRPTHERPPRRIQESLAS